LVFLLACATLMWPQALTAGNKPPLTLDEFFNSVDISSIRLSPDGHMIVIGTERADWDAQRFRKDLWLWRDSDNTLIPLTQSGHDWSPDWSPDGKWIAFLSDRRVEVESADKSSDDDSEEETHLYVIPVGGGEAFPVTRGEEGVHTFDWAPDSKSLYFATRVPWSSKQKEENTEEWKDTIRYRERERGDVISRITLADALARRAVKGGAEAKQGATNQDKETAETPGAQIVVTTPYRVKSLSVAPDGARVAFLTDAISERLEGLKEIEVYVASTSSAGPKNTAKQLTKNQAIEEHLEFSPDGKRIFFEVSQGSVESSYADVQPRVYSIDSTTGEPVRWAASFDGSVTEYAVDPQGGMLAPGTLGTATGLYQQNKPAGPFLKLEGWPGTYAHVASAKNSPRLAFAYSEVDKPTEVYIAESPGQLAQAKPITTFNKLFTEHDLPKGKSYQWKAPDGTKVEGMLIYPPGKFEAKGLRTFVLIHGGPGDTDGNKFGADWYDWASFAASKGWLVFRPNYRGSTGYGDKFMMQIVPEIVSRPGIDILSGVDSLVKDGIANSKQLVIGGYSYGGYMTNWLITQTDRFKAAVTGAGAVEHIANWGNDDMTYDDAFFLGGLPWDPKAQANYFKEAAIYQFRKVKTPTHVVAGEDDIRVAVAEDYLLEHALHELGVPSTLLVFPGEGHSLDDNPWHGKIKVREELKWLEKYCACPAQ
jgi:dipeptidyl aminopeptidase/acylaminoacyl peptidase